MPGSPPRWWGSVAALLRAIVILTVVVLAAAGCTRGDPEPVAGDADFGPPPSIEPSMLARPWASSKAAGQAFGRIWRAETRDPRDLEGRGIDAYNWAGRTCDAVRLNGRAPEAMVRRVRKEGKFTQQGARVIVTAALAALCPEEGGFRPSVP